MSGVLNMLLASGGAPGIVSLADTLTGSAVEPSDCTLSINSDGNATLSGIASFTWVSPQTAGIGNHYQVRASSLGGAVPSGTFDSWLDLSSNRAWTLAGISGVQSSTFTIEIRVKTTLEVLDSSAVSMDVT